MRHRTVALALIISLLASGCILATFEESIPDCFNQQEAADDRLTIAANPNGSGNVLRVEVKAGDIAIPADIGTGKSRAELQLTRPCGDRYPIGTEWYYGWNIMVPTDFAVDPTDPLAFQIVGQFHHRSPGSPQIAVHLGLEAGQPVYRIMWREAIDDPTTELATIPFTPGDWTHLGWRIMWSTDPTIGEIELRVDGVDVFGVFEGTTAYDDDPKSLKIGLYRGAGYTTDNVLYYDTVVIGDSWSNVGA